MEGRNPKRAQGTRGVGADHPWCSRPSLENPVAPCAANFASNNPAKYKPISNSCDLTLQFLPLFSGKIPVFGTDLVKTRQI